MQGRQGKGPKPARKRPATPPPVIRGVVSADRDALDSIIRRSGNLSEEERDCARELLEIYLENGEEGDYIFLAAADASGRPLGFVCYGMASLAERVYDLYWIIVDPGHRRAGLGRRLFEHVEGVLKGASARLIMAETSGLDSYLPARRFYLANGFEEEGRIKGFYKPGDDLVIYVKRLQPNGESI